VERLLEWSLGALNEARDDIMKEDVRPMMEEVITRLREFMENEARSCSMDFGCVTPEYVFRSWGGSVAMDEIATGLTELRKQGIPELGI